MTAANGAAGRGGIAKSFAKLLEAGSSARAVSANRALGFSETGIMGLHFAIRAGSAPSADDGPKSFEDTCSAAMIKMGNPSSAEHQAKLAPSSLQTAASPGPSLPAERASTPTGTNNAKAGTARSDTLLRAGILPEVSEDGEPNRLPFHAARAAVPETGRPSRLQVKLLSLDDEVAVIADGFGQDAEAQRELEKAAKEIAAEFGVTIRQFVVSSISSTDK